MKVSIITVCYNSAETLRDTLDSILNQDYRDIEYIVVDGASKDGTLSIIQEYEPLFEGRMKWLSGADKNMYDAMNKGIRLASGDVVGTLNSNDFYSADAVVSKVVGAFRQEDVELVYGDVHFVKPDDLTRCVRYYSSALFRPALLRFGFMPAHPSVYIKRDCFTKFGSYDTDFDIAADFELLARYILTYKVRYKYLNLDFVTMRTGGKSSNTLVLNKEILEACRRNGIYTNLLMLYSRYLYKVFELAIRK
ncbi:MAG: glycosyltransferase family 2 protein [Gammaproteobacteria bacterium]